jgi:hypothetical protein
MNKKILKEIFGVVIISFLVVPNFAYSLETEVIPAECLDDCSVQVPLKKISKQRKITPSLIAQILKRKRTLKKEKIELVVVPEIKKNPLQLETPEKVKGIYVTGYTFQNEKRMNEIIELVETTELNTIVIDIQDDAGNWMFPPKELILKQVPVSKYALTHEEFASKLKILQNKKIYTIVRVVTFQSPEAEKYYPNETLKHINGNNWKNWKGIGWLDMTNRNAWKIPLAKARESIGIGFDEIQFDYIRFPSDGMISQIAYHNLPKGKQKHEAMTDFFEYLSAELTPYKTPISADIFGFTYIRSQAENDLNIGQRVIDFAKYFDHLSPMVYPSHYPDGFLGIENPALEPYTIVNIASRDGNDLISRVPNSRAQSRPWLQYFNLGALYDRNKIQAQINAVEAYPNSGWIFWNPRNQYEADYFDAQ